MEEEKKLIEDLLFRVKELERIVRELVDFKKDKEEIVLDENWKALWYRLHDYWLKD